MVRTCSFIDCGGPHVARGLCRTHYNQAWRGGQPRSPRPAKREPELIRHRDAQGRKLCLTCDTWLPEKDFSSRSRRLDGLNYECRTCQHIATIAIKYGLSPADYRALLVAQDFRCAICSQPFGTKNPSTDHDHNCCPGKTACGKCVRGLLCGSCNLGLGAFKDDISNLRKAIEYLKGGSW